jgi:3D (Asp-Asp-Asp) domain-containing protein
MANDWGTAVVVDPRALDTLREDNVRLGAAVRRRTAALWVLTGLALGAGAAASLAASGRGEAVQDLEVCRDGTERANLVLEVLARSQSGILSATEHAPSVGTKSWGRRFTVTKYLPRDPRYGRFNDGLTATLMKADPAARIVAVDPKLIPYGSWVWVEGLGWFQAQDCGSAIKGFRLDLLTATEADAMAFGRQERFAIVVPPDAPGDEPRARGAAAASLLRSAEAATSLAARGVAESWSSAAHYTLGATRPD